MINLRELRANRLGISFEEKPPNEPFRFISDSLLLRILYAITRPNIKKTPKAPVRPIATFEPVRTFVARRFAHGKDDPDQTV